MKLQRTTGNFPISHHAQLVLPHSSTHITIMHSFRALCTCHCNTPNSCRSVIGAVWNAVQLTVQPLKSHPLLSPFGDSKIRALTYFFNITAVWGMWTWEKRKHCRENISLKHHNKWTISCFKLYISCKKKTLCFVIYIWIFYTKNDWSRYLSIPT